MGRSGAGILLWIATPLALGAQVHLAPYEGWTVGAAADSMGILLGDTVLPTERRGAWSVAVFEGPVEVETAPFGVGLSLRDLFSERAQSFAIGGAGPFVLAHVLAGEQGDTIRAPHPVLHVLCARNGGSALFVDTEEDIGTGRVIVGATVDGGEEIRGNWSASPDRQDVSFPADVNRFVLHELLPGKELVVRYKPYRRPTRRARFSLDGFGAIVALMAEECGIRP